MITSGIERINPEIAKKYLETNIGHQRNVSYPHVDHLKRQMECGQWMMTGEPITFDDKGRVVNGQHRLKAVIASGLTIEFMVVRGVSTESFMAMDRGKSRSSGNVFAIHGVKNSNNIAACVGGVLNYRRAIDAKGSLNSNIRPSIAAMMAEYDAHSDKYSLAFEMSNACRKIIKPSIPSTVSAIALIDANHSAEKVSSFWNAVGIGENLASGSPMLYLRNKYIDHSASKAKLPTALIMAITIKAWNSYVLGRRCDIIRVRVQKVDDNGIVQEGEGCPKVL